MIVDKVGASVILLSLLAFLISVSVLVGLKKDRRLGNSLIAFSIALFIVAELIILLF